MMKKQSLILATAVAATLASSVATAELSANAAASTNYIWRGVTQTGDNAALSGGIDWSGDSGLYAGIWVSNLGPGLGQEVDLYAGYGLELADDMGLDIGAIVYDYPLNPNTRFAEVYANLAVSNVTAGVAMTVSAGSANKGAAFDSGDLYASVSADFEPFTVYAGTYMYDANPAGATDYIHYGVSMSKDDFTFSIDKNDIDNASAMRVGVTWSKEWEL